MKDTSAFAEVIESSLHSWKAQSWQWDRFPQFGSLVTITSAERTLFGLVHTIETGPTDTVRMPYPFQQTEEELLHEQPQIFASLKTTFSCLTVGYQEGHRLLYQWAPQPPKMHAFVAEATMREYEQFFTDEQYIHILFGLAHQLFNLDELLLAILKNLSDRMLLDQARLQAIIATFSLLTGNDYRRLKLFLQRVTPCITLQTRLTS